MNVVVSAYQRVKNTIADTVYDNPVVIKDFRTRMRGHKAFLIMGGYVLFLAAVLFIAYMQLWSGYMNSGYGNSHSFVNQKIGMSLFIALTWTQAILLTLIIPAIVSGAISYEIEKKTIELLALTRITSGKIVVGKQLSGFFYTLMLLVCSLPLSGICLMFGGISPAEVVITYVLLISCGFMFTCIGVFWSSLFNRTATATLLSYATCGLYMLFTVPLGFALVYIMSPYSSAPSRDIFLFGAMNPGFAPYGALLSGLVCGVHVPLALVTFGLEVAFGLLLLLTATTHLRYRRVDRSLSIKLLLLGITAVFIWLLVGNLSAFVWGRSLRSMLDMLSVFATVIFSIVSLGAAIFATGEIKKKPDDSVANYATSLSKAFTSDLSGGISFTLLWTIIAYGIFGATCLWAIKTGAPHTHIQLAFWTAYFKIGAAILAMVLGVSAIGVLASSVVKTRKGAAALVFVFVLLAFAIYGIILASYENGVSDSRQIVWQLAALWPMTPILTATNQWNNYMPHLYFRNQDMWYITSGIYLLMAAAALGIASSAVKKYGGVKEE